MDLLRRSRRARCRHRRLSITGVAALLPLIPAVAQCDGGTRYRGDTFPSIGCTATGISWSGVTTGFLGYTEIRYHWMIYRNGRLWITGESVGTYYTDRTGTHFRLPNSFPQQLDCGPGVYSITMWAQGTGSNAGWQTTGHTDETVCK